MQLHWPSNENAIRVRRRADSERYREALRLLIRPRRGIGPGQYVLPSFWALRFGVLVDQFGTPWVVNCERAGLCVETTTPRHFLQRNSCQFLTCRRRDIFPGVASS